MSGETFDCRFNNSTCATPCDRCFDRVGCAFRASVRERNEAERLREVIAAMEQAQAEHFARWSAEVERLRGLLSEALDALEADSEDERREVWEKIADALPTPAWMDPKENMG